MNDAPQAPTPTETPRRGDPVAAALAELRAKAELLLAEAPDLLEDERAWLDTLEGMTDAFELIDRLVRRSLARQRLADAAAAEIADLVRRKQRFERQAEAAREAALVLVQACVPPDKRGRVRLERASYTLSLAATPPTVVLTDPAALPARFLRTPEPQPDKTAIKAALQAGEAVPGAALSNGGVSLRVSTR